MNKTSIIVVTILFIVSVSFVVLSNKNKKDTGSSSTQTNQSQSTQTTSSNQNNYLDYSEDNFEASKEKGNTLLFFHASWCPTCRSLEKELNNRPSDIPEDITILNIDYDKNKEMKLKYNVTTQHTIVMLDSSGNEIKRWVGGGLDALLHRVNRD
jgi:thioredoxin-related protein